MNSNLSFKRGGMDRIKRYLEITNFKEKDYNLAKRNNLFNYCFFRAKKLSKKFEKAKIASKKKFFNEIKEITYAYADCRVIDKNVVHFIENSIVKFVSLIVIKVNFVSFLRLSKRPMFEDVLFIIRKNPSKTKRIIYLIKMKEVIEKLVKQTKNSNQVPKEIISNCKKLC
jgi:hypothetical protein